MRTRRGILFTLMFGVLTAIAAAAEAADTREPQTESDQTPPRLSLTDGQVSFWRPGAQDWAAAQVNTPLAPGDALSTGSPGHPGGPDRRARVRPRPGRTRRSASRTRSRTFPVHAGGG